MPGFIAALDAHRPALALALLSRGLRVGGMTDALPLWANRALNAALISTVEKDIKANLRTVPAEAAAGLALDGPASRYASCTADTLLLVGQRSPSYFADAALAVGAVVPALEVQVLPGLDHNAPMLKPRRILDVVSAFLSADDTGRGASEARLITSSEG
jgi:pimeloyl-ACP methyl ester carboxylesterase